MQGNHIVWSDINLDFEDWRNNLQEQYPDESEDKLISRMYDINREYLDDERVNLDIQLSQSIIVIGDLGLWNGRANGYKIIESGNIKDCLYSDCDMNEWYVDKNGDFRCTAIHHDGRNHYLYRTFKPIGIKHFEQLTFNKVKRTLIPVIRKGEYFDLEATKKKVGDYITELMQITEPEQEFLHKFADGIYEPELVFDDDEILERIRNHPMAIWKTSQMNK